MYHVIYSRDAEDDLNALDDLIAKRIVQKIYYYSTTQNPLRFAKKLVYAEIGEYRFRVGDYRIIFDCNNKGGIIILLILKIGHRKDIYTHI